MNNLTYDNKIIKVMDVTHPYGNLENKIEYKQVIPIEILNYAGLLFGLQPTTHNIYTPFKRDIMDNFKNKVVSLQHKIIVQGNENSYTNILIQPDFLVTTSLVKMLGGEDGNYSIGTVLNMESDKPPIDITIKSINEKVTYYKCLSCQINITSDEPNELLIGYTKKRYHPKINITKKLQDGDFATDIRNLLLINNEDENFIRKNTNCKINMVLDSDSIDKVGFFNQKPPTINADEDLDIITEYKQLKKNNNKTLKEVLSDEGQLELYNMININEMITNNKENEDLTDVLEIILQPSKSLLQVEFTLFYQIYYIDSFTKEFKLTRYLKQENTFTKYDRVLLLLYLMLKKIMVTSPLELKLMIVSDNFTKSGITPEVYEKIRNYLRDENTKNLLVSILNTLD